MKSARIAELLRTTPRSSKSWGLYLQPSDTQTQLDIGIAVAKKFAKRAVDRNKLKRMIRELVRGACNNSAPACDIVVRLKKAAGQETRGRLRKKELLNLKQQLVKLI